MQDIIDVFRRHWKPRIVGRLCQTPIQAMAFHRNALQLSQRLIEVLDQIIRIFEPDGQAQQTFG